MGDLIYIALAIHWSSKNVQRVAALVDLGAECTLIYGHTDKFSGRLTAIITYGRKTARV